jgi:thiol-disulfide isomerase/thioredoxin
VIKFIRLIVLVVFVFSSPTIVAGNISPQKRRITNAWELPPLILHDLDGKSHNLYEWHGKVIMLNFWATWCGPCQIEIPDFIDYQARYADKGLQIIGVGLDEKRKLRNFVRTVGINYPILQADPEIQFSLLRHWGNTFAVLPFTVIIGRDGHLVFMQQGIFSREAFTRIVEPLLAP